MQSPYGGGPYPGPPQPPSSGLSPLTIVLLVLGGMFVLGAGACVMGAVFAFRASAPPPPAATSVPVVPAPATEEPAAEDDPPPTKPKPVAPTKPVGPPSTASTKKGPRTVDFVCPPGKAPGGVVRAGCMCGSDILGTACGAGGFSDVQPTTKGCRFTCD